jgi:hypothetical protein
MADVSVNYFVKKSSERLNFDPKPKLPLSVGQHNYINLLNSARNYRKKGEVLFFPQVSRVFYRL